MSILTALNSDYWIKTVFPAFKRKYPTDANKISAELNGERKPLPSSNFARGIVEEIREALAGGPIVLPIGEGYNEGAYGLGVYGK